MNIVYIYLLISVVALLLFPFMSLFSHGDIFDFIAERAQVELRTLAKLIFSKL